MSRCFIGGDRDPCLATPPPEDIEAFQTLADVLDDVDMSAFEDAYRADGSGGRPYDPRLMVTALVWCFQRGWRSPSQIARHLRNDASLRDWFGSRIPSRSTVRGFLLAHQGAWKALFPQILRLCDEAGLVDPSITATDGTVLDSPGSLRGDVPAWRIRQEIREVTESLEALAGDNAHRAEALDDQDLNGFVERVCVEARAEETRMRRRLSRLVVAEKTATGRALAEKPGQGPDPAKITKRLGRQEATLARMWAEQEARVAKHARDLAECPHGAGRAPRSPDEHAHIARQRQAVECTKKNSR